MVYTNQILVKLPDELKEELRIKAEKEGISMSELVRRIIIDYIYNHSENHEGLQN